MLLSRVLNDRMGLGNKSHSSGEAPAPLRLAGDCRPDCPICHGLGWVRYDVPVGDPNFGRMVLCPELLPKVLAAESGLSPDEQALTWSAVAALNNTPAAVEAVRRVLERGAGWVYLWGPPGLAKSLILQIAVAEAVRLERPAAYVRMVEILDNLRSAFDAPEPGQAGLRLDRWAEVPLLAVDEFDRLNATPWALERKFLLLDRRYQDAIRGQSITLMASNSDPASFEDYLASRIFDGRFAVVRLAGEDVRPAMEW